MQPEASIFQVQFNEQGKTYLRKFVRISYSVMGLAVFGSCVSIYWSVKDILFYNNANAEIPYSTRALSGIFFPLLWIVKDVFAIVSNVYFARFPRLLLGAVEQGDEHAANRSFLTILRSAWIFLLILLIDTAEIIWSLLAK